MKSVHRRRVLSALQAVAAVSVIGIVLNCGGGERPPPTRDTGLDAAAPPAAASGAFTVLGVTEAGELFFGDAGYTRCGEQAGARTITLDNLSNDVVRFKAGLSRGGDYYALDITEGELKAKQRVTVTISPTAIPAVSDIAEGLFDGTLDITTDDNTPLRSVRLRQTARGAVVKSTIGAAGLDFGSVRVSRSTTLQLSLTNSGNEPVTATMTLGSDDFRIDDAQTTTVVLNPGVPVAKTMRLAPTKEGALVDNLSVSYTPTKMCGEAPELVNLKGVGTNSLAVSPGTHEWGAISCGSQGDFKEVLLDPSNDVIVTATLEKGDGSSAPFRLRTTSNDPIVSGSQLTLTANELRKIRVVPQPIPARTAISEAAYSDRLFIRTVPATQDFVVELKQRPSGAIFNIAGSPAFAPGAVGIEVQGQPVLTIINNGNASGEWSLLGFSPPFRANLTSGTLTAGASVAVTTYATTPAVGNTSTTNIQLQTTSVICADLPGSIGLSITKN